jgi:hypothetical protein
VPSFINDITPNGSQGVVSSRPVEAHTNLQACQALGELQFKRATTVPALPQLVDIDRLPDWRSRNQAITDWYHEVDACMTQYLGDPALPSWARFAKHASYNAGQTLAELERSILLAEDLRDCGKQASAALEHINFRLFGQSLKHFQEALVGFLELVRDPAALECAAIASLVELNNGPCDSSLKLAASFHDKPGSLANTSRAIIKCLLNFPAIVRDLPETITNLHRLFETVAQSNCQIYTFMAPRLDSFLQSELFGAGEALSSAEHIDDVESAAFLHQALRLYSEASHAAVSRDDKAPIVLQANLLATYGEQLHRVQPEFTTVAAIIHNMKLLMSFSLPDGSREPLAPAASSWADIHQRFGFCYDCGDITPENLRVDLLRSSGDPLFKGTIGELLVRGTLDSELALSLLEQPQKINMVTRQNLFD